MVYYIKIYDNFASAHQDVEQKSCKVSSEVQVS